MTAFIDEARIAVRGGDGGNGAVAFRREKYVPKGGPAGGDGGDGGSVVLSVDAGMSTLLDFRYRTEYRAKSGESGGNKDMYGRGGEDLVLRVPPGTQVFQEGSDEPLADLRLPDERFVVARGGRGGRGNIHFMTSTDRAPRRAEPGRPGKERVIRLELKLLADVGLLGFPNVGKSSLITRISAARPKVADYPFTTLVPHLGVVRMSGDRSFVVADVPGLIEGAHEGAGLGLRFLRHLERTRVLVHMLELSPVPGRTPLRDYATLRRELRLHDEDMAKRPEIVVINKVDLPETRKKIPALTQAFAKKNLTVLGISTVTGEGLPQLLEFFWRALQGSSGETARVLPAAHAEVLPEKKVSVAARARGRIVDAKAPRAAPKAKRTGAQAGKPSAKARGKSATKAGVSKARIPTPRPTRT